MMNEWLVQQFLKLAKEETDYQRKALFLKAVEISKKQEERFKHAQAEMDGRLWNKREW